MWFLLIPAGIFLWVVAQRAAEQRLQRGTGEARQLGPTGPAARMPWDHLPTRPMAAPPPRTSGPPTAADYLRHLNEACWASRMLDEVKPAALAADVTTLMQSPPETAQALQILCQPIDATFLQKDLNVLGAEPPLPEDGRPGRATTEAVKALQGRFGMHPTGEVDAQTVAAVRYAVGCIYSQDKVSHGGD
jgi:hypothetical protein